MNDATRQNDGGQMSEAAGRVLDAATKGGDGRPANLPAITGPTFEQGNSQAQLQAIIALNAPADAVWTSCPNKTVRERAVLLGMMLEEHASISDNINKTLHVQHLIVSRRTKTDDATGEVIALPYYVLVGEDGVCYQGYGSVPLNSLRTIIGQMGSPPWSPPLPIRIEPWSNGPDRKSARLILDVPAYLDLLDKLEGRGNVKKGK